MSRENGLTEVLLTLTQSTGELPIMNRNKYARALEKDHIGGVILKNRMVNEIKKMKNEKVLNYSIDNDRYY